MYNKKVAEVEVKGQVSRLIMVFRRPKSPPSAISAAGDPSDLGTTQAGETPHDVAVKQDPDKSDDTYQEQSAARVSLLLISVFMSMFLVALDRTIISTVSELP